MKPSPALPAVLVFALCTGIAWPQEAEKTPSHHDVNGQGCASCHVTRTLPAAGAEQACDRTALWDCDLPGRTFHTYDLPIPNHKTDEGEPVDDTEVRMSSVLCASCHDGVGTPSMSRTPGFAASNGSRAAKGLQTEHPINVPQDPGVDPTLATPATVNRLVKLFGHHNAVQCSSCHDPHESANPKLLRMPNKNSELCLTCHL